MRILADRPIQTSKQDLLGRVSFARSLAAAIEKWNGTQSLVVALYGAWGSGKSSVKNMVVEALEALPNSHRPIIVEFDAWQFSGQEGLLRAFFQETARALGVKDKSENGQKLAAKWRSLSAFFDVVKSASITSYILINGALHILPTITLATFTWSYFGTIFGLIAVASIVTISALFSELISSASIKISDWMTARAEAQRKTLEERKQELKDLLANNERPLLIIVDDIDRLTAMEVQLMFRVVKANLDIPRVSYLLLFQRDIVEGALEEVTSSSGRDFLEKIVQAGFDMPAVEPQRLQQVLFSELNKIVEDKIVEPTFSQKRWANIFIPGLSPYFQTLRDVYRFVSTLSFHVGVLKWQTSFEVNIVDLIGIEVLRVFEPEVYSELRSAKGILTGKEQQLKMRGSEKDTSDYVRQRTEHLLERASKNSRKNVQEILQKLFPPIEWVFNGSHYGSDFQDEWYRNRRVCSFDVFDRYFMLGIPQDDISHSDIERILSSTRNRTEILNELRAFEQRGQLLTLLARLDNYKEHIGIDHLENLITALFDLGDNLPERPVDFFSIAPEGYASRIIYWGLRKESDIHKRGQCLARAIKNTTGIYLPAYIVSQEGAIKEPDKRLTSDTDLTILRNLCLEKIQHAAGTMALAKSSRLLSLLYDWCRMAGENEPKEWVKKLIASGGVLNFLRAALHRTASRSIGDYVSEFTEQIPIKYIEDFVPLEMVNDAVTKIPASSIDSSYQGALAAWKETWHRKQTGKGDKTPFDPENGEE